jgi:hypothetical protein
MTTDIRTVLAHSIFEHHHSMLMQGQYSLMDHNIHEHIKLHETPFEAIRQCHDIIERAKNYDTLDVLSILRTAPEIEPILKCDAALAQQFVHVAALEHAGVLYGLQILNSIELNNLANMRAQKAFADGIVVLMTEYGGLGEEQAKIYTRWFHNACVDEIKSLRGQEAGHCIG